MADNSKIEWTDATWNFVTGCTKVSAGCDNCYAETLAERFRGTPGHYFENGFDVTLRPERLVLPLRWRKPRMVFVNSMSDLFHEKVPDELIARAFAMMAQTPRHTYQILTKRPARMRALVGDAFGGGVRLIDAAENAGDEETARALYEADGWPLPNVWLGVSAEDQATAERRVPALLETAAAVRFVSAEPLLGPVDLTALAARGGAYLDALAGVVYAAAPGCVDWVICGGESGPRARPMHPSWARSLRDQTAARGRAFFMKQWGEFAPARNDEAWQVGTEFWPVWRYGKKSAGRFLDGREWNEMPAAGRD